mmetsp:Transcript_4198/g.13657  ORF Transcript_4198/g.13657 Transcript_4198/m.13657 type:complete len:295 (-) Transcript_4198:470-1354(-)
MTPVNGEAGTGNLHERVDLLLALGKGGQLGWKDLREHERKVPNAGRVEEATQVANDGRVALATEAAEDDADNLGRASRLDGTPSDGARLAVPVLFLRQPLVVRIVPNGGQVWVRQHDRLEVKPTVTQVHNNAAGGTRCVGSRQGVREHGRGTPENLAGGQRLGLRRRDAHIGQTGGAGCVGTGGEGGGKGGADCGSGSSKLNGANNVQGDGAGGHVVCSDGVPVRVAQQRQQVGGAAKEFGERVDCVADIDVNLDKDVLYATKGGRRVGGRRRRQHRAGNQARMSIVDEKVYTK